MNRSHNPKGNFTPVRNQDFFNFPYLHTHFDLPVSSSPLNRVIGIARLTTAL
jgi:hypothetical protein